MLSTWRITKSGNSCCTCGKDLPENRLFFSCLIEEGGEFERRDLCPTCWEEHPPAAPFCFWRTRRAHVQRKPVLDTEAMFGFFERLEGAETQKKRLFRFVLALYLMRRKELKLLQVRRDGEAELLILERRTSRARVEVDNPGVTEECLQETAAQLSELLSTCLDV